MRRASLRPQHGGPHLWGSPTVGVPGAAARRWSAARSWRRRNRKLPGGVLLEFMEVPAQRFVMCLCQNETGRVAAGSSRHATTGVRGCPGHRALRPAPHRSGDHQRPPRTHCAHHPGHVFLAGAHNFSSTCWETPSPSLPLLQGTAELGPCSGSCSAPRGCPAAARLAPALKQQPCRVFPCP